MERMQRRTRLFQSTLPVGGATGAIRVKLYNLTFQSTLPVGGATGGRLDSMRRVEHFNPRSPWGERPPVVQNVFGWIKISIHAPRGGSDSKFFSGLWSGIKFQSTLPVGGATRKQPRNICRMSFQSTLPVGGATQQKYPRYKNQ